MTGGNELHPVMWGEGELPYACDDCQAPAVAVRPGGLVEPWGDELAADHCWCLACWLQHWGALAA